MIVYRLGRVVGAHEVRTHAEAPTEIGPDIRQIQRIHARLFNKVPPTTGGIDFALVLDAFSAVKTTLREQLADFIPFP